MTLILMYLISIDKHKYFIIHCLIIELIHIYIRSTFITFDYYLNKPIQTNKSILMKYHINIENLSKIITYFL